jgi:hypothetical protein
MKRIVTAFLGLIIAGSAVLSMSDAASAHPRGINQRQYNQQNRIYRGVRNGSLTPRELSRLERQQGRIQAQESRFRSDGHLSYRERRILHHRLNNSSHNIYRAKHNGRYHH